MYEIYLINTKQSTRSLIITNDQFIYVNPFGGLGVIHSDKLRLPINIKYNPRIKNVINIYKGDCWEYKWTLSTSITINELIENKHIEIITKLHSIDNILDIFNFQDQHPELFY